MTKFIEKISQYNLLNAFLPGIFFVYLANHIAKTDLLTHEIVFDIFVIYMFGIICSRVGSLIVEPILKKIGFIKFAKYEDYLKAASKDTKITELITDNNFYRTIIASCLLAAFFVFFNFIQNKCIYINEHSSLILLALCFLLFLFSYRKQTKYITSRVEKDNQ